MSTTIKPGDRVLHKTDPTGMHYYVARLNKFGDHADLRTLASAHITPNVPVSELEIVPDAEEMHDPSDHVGPGAGIGVCSRCQ